MRENNWRICHEFSEKCEEEEISKYVVIEEIYFFLQQIEIKPLQMFEISFGKNKGREK